MDANGIHELLSSMEENFIIRLDGRCLQCSQAPIMLSLCNSDGSR